MTWTSHLGPVVQKNAYLSGSRRFLLCSEHGDRDLFRSTIVEAFWDATPLAEVIFVFAGMLVFVLARRSSPCHALPTMDH